MADKNKNIRAAVIGSGFGGIAMAIRLQTQGISTTLYEKRDKPGGRAYVFEDKGFTFDAGPTVITAPHVLRELFEEAGKKLEDYVELLPVTPFYRLSWASAEGVRHFDYSNDEAELHRQIAEFEPDDVEGYKKFYQYSQAVFDEGYTKLVHVPFLKIWDMVAVSPKLLKLKAYRSVYSTIADFIKNPYLRQAFSFHSLLIGGSPFQASAIYTLIHFLERKWGVFFPKGGTGALVKALIKLFEELGGEVKLNSEIDRIVTDKGKVTGIATKAGQFTPYDLVVSNADVHQTYHNLLRGESKAGMMRYYTGRSSYSMSLFLIYFGTKKTYPDMAHHTVIFGPRYRELLDDIFKRGVLADDFSLYLHRPTVTDPNLAPEGCDSFYVLSPVPHLGKAHIDWKVEGPKYADKILSYLETHYLPGLRENIVTERIFTPEDFKSELNAHLGSAFSLEPTLVQSAYFRIHNRDPRIKGLYFVGAGTHPGAGVPGVVNSAKATASVILGDLEKGRPEAIGQMEWSPA